MDTQDPQDTQEPPVERPATASSDPDAPEAPSNDGTPPGASVVDGEPAQGEPAPEEPSVVKPPRPRPKGGRTLGAKDAPEPPPLDPVEVMATIPVAGEPNPRDPQMGSTLTKKQRDAVRRVVASGKKRDKEKAAHATKRGGKKKAREAKEARAASGKKPQGAPAWSPSEEEKAQIMALAGLGMSIDETCMVLGIKYDTMMRHRETVEQWRAAGLAIAKSRVRQAGYQQAVSGSLGHWRFFEERVLGYNPRVEHTGLGGGPIETASTTRPLSDQELLDRLRTLNDKAASITARPRSDYTPPHDPLHGARPMATDAADADAAADDAEGADASATA